MEIVEEVIAEKQLKIDIITCTDYHAFFGVLYTLGFNSTNIKKKLADTQYLFEQNP
jgi:hypothetical protein